MLGIKGTHDCLSVLFTVTAFLKNTRKYIASWLDALRFLQYFKRVYSEAHQLCVNIFEWCNSRKYMIFLTLQRCMQCFETSRWPQNKPFRSVDYAGFITYTFHTHTHTHTCTHIPLRVGLIPCLFSCQTEQLSHRMLKRKRTGENCLSACQNQQGL